MKNAPVWQRMFRIALGYEDLDDHDRIRFDPVLVVMSGKLSAECKDCAPLVGTFALNQLETP